MPGPAGSSISTFYRKSNVLSASLAHKSEAVIRNTGQWRSGPEAVKWLPMPLSVSELAEGRRRPTPWTRLSAGTPFLLTRESQPPLIRPF